MRAPRATRLLAALTTLVTLACAAETGADPGGTAPGATAPAVGVTSLDGIRLRLREVAEVRDPVAMTARPGSSSIYVAEKPGRVRRIAVERQVTEAGVVVRSTYRADAEALLDLTGEIDDAGERGLLGLAFSPDGTELYTYFTERSGRISLDAWRMDGEQVATGTRRQLLRIDHPRPNHNGGQLATGPDGFLYVGIGDGGGGGDPDRNGQNPRTLLGKILRIDPSRPGSGRPYGIPDGNPFPDGSSGAPEVWAYGLRNPWRFSFDRRTEDLWIGDVGQNAWEEIDFLPAAPGGAGRGANLGWNRMEGRHSYNDGTPPENHVLPLHEYPLTDETCSVVSGYVYRGATRPEWQGVYLWADYCDGEIHVLLRHADGRVEDRGTGLSTPEGDLQNGGSITSFGEDDNGELYVLSAAGRVYLVEAA